MKLPLPCCFVLAALCYPLESAEKPADGAKPTIVVVAEGTPDYPRNSEGGVVELKDGAWLQVWSEWLASAETGGDFSPCNLVAAISRDEGRTWTGKRVLIRNQPEDLNVMPSSIIRLDNGEIMLQFHRLHSRAQRSG